MEAEHCLLYRKHPSTLSNSSFPIIIFQPLLTPIPFTHSSNSFSNTQLSSLCLTSNTFIDPSMMAPPAGRTYSLHGFKVAITVAFIFSFSTFLFSKSGGSVFSDTNESLEESKVVIGSKPPACVNKCMNCRPCMATVVVPNHQRKGSFKVSSHGEDDSYYLLSWKCRCGDKLFQP